MIALKLAIRSLGVVSTIILARLLIPSDFGLVALGAAMIAVVEIFSSFNFEVALIQNQEATRHHYDTTWTLNLIFAVATGVVLVLLAAPTALFYNEPRLATIMWFLAVGVVITGFTNVGVVNFRKHLKFHREFRFMMIQKILGFAVVVPLAFILRNYWALVGGILASRIAGVGASYIMHSFRPSFSLSAWRELVDFSKWLLLNNALYVLRHRSADFIIGKTAGTRQLGVFALSYEISNLATTELATPIDRAIMPGFSQMSSELGTLRDGYFSVIGMIALIGLPTAFGIAATADLFVPLFLGPKWLETIQVIRILAIAGAMSILASSAGSICIAVGKPKYLIPLGGIYVITLLPMLLILTPKFHGLGAAWAYIGAAAVSLPVHHFIALKLLDANFSRLITVVYRPILGAIAMFGIVRLIVGKLHAPSSLVEQGLELAAVVSIGFVAYVVIVFGLWTMSKRPAGAEAVVVESTISFINRR